MPSRSQTHATASTWGMFLVQCFVVPVMCGMAIPSSHPCMHDHKLPGTLPMVTHRWINVWLVAKEADVLPGDDVAIGASNITTFPPPLGSPPTFSPPPPGLLSNATMTPVEVDVSGTLRNNTLIVLYGVLPVFFFTGFLQVQSAAQVTIGRGDNACDLGCCMYATALCSLCCTASLFTVPVRMLLFFACRCSCCCGQRRL